MRPEFQSWIAEIRGRLSSPPPLRMKPSAAKEPRRAAVFVPLFVDAGELWTVLTKRSAELPQHKGQIAFPGGGLELGEDEWTAALRESEEEMGWESRVILRLGELDEVDSSTGFRLIPCVGAIPWPIEMKPNAGEIEEVFALPLRAFARPAAIEDRVVKLNGRERTVRVYHVGRHPVWGLTALVMRNLLERLGMPIAEEDAPDALA
jgi:8-oxo-dGTP pyrophosphatase MutT (NUDIX family)